MKVRTRSKYTGPHSLLLLFILLQQGFSNDQQHVGSVLQCYFSIVEQRLF